MQKLAHRVICTALLLAIATCLLCACHKNIDYNQIKYMSQTEFENIEERIKNGAERHFNAVCHCNQVDLYECPLFLEECGKTNSTILGYTGNDPDFDKNFYVAIDKQDCVHVASFPIKYHKMHNKEIISVIDKKGDLIYSLKKYGRHFIYSRYIAEYIQNVQTYNEVNSSIVQTQHGKLYIYNSTEELPEEKFNSVTMEYKIFSICKYDNLDNYTNSGELY